MKAISHLHNFLATLLHNAYRLFNTDYTWIIQANIQLSFRYDQSRGNNFNAGKMQAKLDLSMTAVYIYSIYYLVLIISL